MPESERGCGWRKVGGAYLVGSGLSVPCDALPIPLDPCGECGFEVPFSRAMQMVHIGYLASKIPKRHMEHHGSTGCTDPFPCPICGRGAGKKFALMFVSGQYYTPRSFIEEARSQGVSKRVAPQSLPSDFKIGETWVMLAYKKYPFYPKGDKSTELAKAEPILKPAIFYAYRPERCEILLWKDTPAEEILEWENKGFTPVLIEETPENVRRHGGGDKKQ